MIPHFLWHWNFGTEWHWCWCGDIHRSFLFVFDLQSTVPNGDEVRDTMLKQSEDCRAWWKLQSKTKEQRKKNRWSQRAEENHGKSGPLQNQQVNQADFYTSNTGFSTKCIFSETVFQGFMNQCLMPLYSRWISMIWIL